MTMVYIAHPFEGKQENVQDVEAIILILLRDNKECTFYSPLHATGFFYNEMDYLTGMNHCFEALSRCDELWLCGGWKKSNGCRMEYAYAKAKGLPISVIRAKKDTYGELYYNREELL